MKDLLLNLLLLFMVLLFFQLIVVDRLNSLFVKYQKILIFILVSVAAILCMLFSINIGGQFIFDLRLIPVLLGGLYGGPKLSLLLFILVMGVRLPFGGIGIVNTIIIMAMVTFAAFMLSKRYRKLMLAEKLIMVTSLSAVFSVISLLIPEVVLNFKIDISFMLLFFITQTIGTLMIAYTAELIIENYHLDTALMKNEKMEVVSQLAASISHEVRNPMTVTRGFLQLLKDPAIDEAKRAYYLETALEELDRAESIISDYLTFAKPHLNEMVKLSVQVEVRKAIDLITPYANHYSVEVIESLQEQLYIKGDSAKFQQCLLNLLKNGIEAMPDGGILHITSNENEKNLILQIADTGLGMTPEQLKRLGEPYFSTKEGKGTGLGMMVVYRIIESMDGTIKAESKVNKGTQFTIRLPLMT
ncbi:HAMP domain-containing histidine kinase [Bacillus sp. ISL-47]|uniref:ATP-binding protein n=1 Tax=Bacillus sp. ISL-47 TaxID=2819130 RepID=UPI001BEB7A0F|nr:sensor histidine kinase [Bacillus sp. ISL-47]MBT2690694.1 HAMP domain-containing histidine kinase [Bacillus sp. ISL-47]MBT2709639.1 HAMP domain-containing histidine kinase [Pseudomonas sp. ISL-84]